MATSNLSFRNKVVIELVDWKMIGNCFNFSRAKLEAIDRENQTEDQRKVALLDAWGEREGDGATYLKFAEVLYERGRTDLVQVLCNELKLIGTPDKESSITNLDIDICRSPATVTDIAERIETLEGQFDSLHQRFMTEVTENEALSGKELLRVLTMLPVSLRKEYESLIQQILPTLESKNTTTELFLRLNPLFVFVDYGLLDHLVSKFGSPALKGDMKWYVNEVKVFMRETTVGDLMDFWPGEENSHMNYSELKVKFSDDPRSYTLERLNNFRRKFCCKLRLSEFIFGLILLEAGESFYATWLVPSIVAPELRKAIDEIDESFYQEEHVLMISLDIELLYQSVTVVKRVEEDLVVPEAKKQRLDIAKEPPFRDHGQDDQLYGQLLHPLSPVSSFSIADHEQQEDQEFSRMEKGEIKALMNEKDMEILMLKSKLESNSEIMLEFSASISKNISRLETILQGSTDLKEANSELQEMKTKLHNAKLQFEISASNVREARESRFELERENVYIDNITTKPTILELLEKQQRAKEWVLETSSIPPSVHPSDSGLATSIVNISEGSEPPEDFEQQFLQELAMKREELVKKEEAQKKLLEDLAMKQGELKRKEEEIERLRMVLEEANSDKSKVYTERLGEAERNISELEDMLRMKNEEVNGLYSELQHFHIQMEKLQAAEPFNGRKFYCMDKNPHGICVIINNHQFYHPTDPNKARNQRRGAEVDQKNLKLTFNYLQYKVEIYENLTHTQMMDVMLTMAQRNHAEYDSFICIIMTSSNETMVYGADSMPVNLHDLTGVMKMCKTLINKPKMFFIQGCRGDHEDKGHKLEVDQQDTAATHTIPQDADFFFGYATPLGNVAYRSRSHGSWYISELCKVLTKLAYASNLGNMMRKVNDNVCKAFTKDGYKQTAEFVDRLRKEVHFFHFSKVHQQQQL